MPHAIPRLGLCAAAALLTACQGTAIDREAALAATKLEIQVDAAGLPVEVEYHCDPSAVPQAVRDAMTGLYGEGQDVAAEIEWHGGVQYFELTREVDGFAAEAMFTADGQLYNEEVEVPVTEVPQAVQDAIGARFPKGRVSAWEVIRDGQRQLVEYHVKVSSGGKQFKAAVSTAGVLTGVWRETEAEIEVPLG